MTHSAQFDPNVLAARKPDLDSTLAGISAQMEQHFDAPASNTNALEAMHGALHHLIGLLETLHLDGVVVFCAELEIVLAELVADPQQISALHRDVLRHAMHGLAHYLDTLANGADNAALRLFPQYQELQQLRGLETSFELDLFYPGLAVQLPQKVLSEFHESDALPHLKALRSQYQQGLLHWLRQDDVPAALQLMQQALGGVMHSVPRDDGRAFWWIANGLLDCMRFDGLPPELNVRKLLGRIDQQMRLIAGGNAGDVRPVLNEMLYLIGHSHTVSDLVEEIKQVYALERYLPEILPLQPGEVAQLLGAMRDQLHATEESWERCALGSRAACEKFVGHAEQLALQSEKLDRNTLQYLAKQIQKLSQRASGPEHIRLIALDMAMALLLLGSGIRHYGSLDSSFQEQVRILSERMQAALRRQPEDMKPLEELVHLHCRMMQGDVLIHLFNEMLANLQYVGQGLSAFFNDVAKRGELGELLRLLSQVQGGLRISSLEQAEQLLVTVQDHVRRFAQGDDTPDSSESHTMADGLSVLENYLQDLAHGQPGDISSLQAASVEMAKLRQAPAQMVDTTVVQTGTSPIIQRPIGEDQELLEVFLEEAQEVLHTMRNNLEIFQLHLDSREPLVTIRRGFHTLKGSGRMVGLTDLGEVAWCVERALNKWLQDNKPATPGLLHFIDQAAQSFAGWVDALNSQGGASIEADSLIAAAQQIENGIEPDGMGGEEVQRAKIEEPKTDTGGGIAPPATPAEEVMTLGEITLPSALFNIASAEAKQNAEVLRKQLDALRTAPAVVQYDFMRAAHTLAGVNRTMGFTPVAELAYALDNWLQAHIDKALVPDKARLALLEQTIAALEAMTQSVCKKQMPQPHTDLVSRLVADKNDLGGEIATMQVIPEQTGAAQTAVSVAVTPPVVPPIPRMVDGLGKTGKPQVRDDVDAQLLPVFLEEADELCPKIGEGLRAWRDQPGDERQPQLLKRLLHTLKGSARMAGAMRIGELAHGMEEHVLSAAQMDGKAEFWEVLENDFDSISGKLEALRSGETGEDASPEQQRRASDQGTGTGRGAERATPGNILRVRSEVVDQLVNEAGEISVARSRMETELRAFKEGLLELTSSVARLRKQLREVEIQAESQMQARVSLTKGSAEQFDPLEFDRFTRLQELTRFMNESVHDVQTVQQALLKNIDETAAAISAQARLNRELQQHLMSVRMVPFASISERLYRIVRKTGKEMSKRANLDLLGTNVEVDRSVLEKMTAPFEHMLRNAIAHGLEDTGIRIQHGKEPIGEIRLGLRQENNEVVFEFSDDGAGLNFAALREKAEAKGLLQPGDTASDDQLAQLIFVSGISTAAEVTEVAGRGIGMDVVRSEIAALGGRIDVSSEKGLGTRFIIHLPLTLAVAHVLMVRSGDAIYAIPSTMVEQARQVKPAELADFYHDRQIQWQGRVYPFHYLPRLLGDTERVPESLPHNPVLLLRSGEQRIALHVDDLQGNHEAVVKNIGPQLARLQGISGATVSGNGAVVLILNPAQLAQRIATITRKAAPEALRTQPLVMVVDDSLTVRKITTRMLTRAGYQVATAKDGVDALEQLNDISPSVMLLDIEMPRMDGFELAKRLRQDARTQNLPIIMITSRTADKHRDYALQLGVNAYLGKPYQEDVLLQQIAVFASAPKVG